MCKETQKTGTRGGAIPAKGPGQSSHFRERTQPTAKTSLGSQAGGLEIHRLSDSATRKHCGAELSADEVLQTPQ